MEEEFEWGYGWKCSSLLGLFLHGQLLSNLVKNILIDCLLFTVFNQIKHSLKNKYCDTKYNVSTITLSNLTYNFSHKSNMLNNSFYRRRGHGYLSSQLLPPLELDLVQELLQRTVGLPGRAHAAYSLFLWMIRLNVRLTRSFGCYYLHFSIYIFF